MENAAVRNFLDRVRSISDTSGSRAQSTAKNQPGRDEERPAKENGYRGMDHQAVAYEENWTLAEEQAFQLSQAAIRIDQARRGKAANRGPLVDALNGNVEVWVALRTIVMRGDCTLPDEVKQNLTKLAQFVADRTFADGEIAENTLDALININLQISEGLLEGMKRG